MKTTSLGYDPELGKKFAAESNGLVIGRARSSPRKSEEQVRLEYIAEHGRAPDAQQLHDAMLSDPIRRSQNGSYMPVGDTDPAQSTSSAPLSAEQRATKEKSRQERMAKMTPQQLGVLFDSLM